MSTSLVPACLRPAVLERVAEGWPAARVAEWLGENYGLSATTADVLSALRQMNADRGEPAKAIVREPG